MVTDIALLMAYAMASLASGNPQGLVLLLLLFTAFISPIARFADRHNISQHQYADDTQVYMKFTNTSVATQVNNMQACLTELHASQ